jgi:UDP-N-acetylmuramoylalanine--D-glutamate ligase
MPLLPQIENIQKDDVCVVELSSFQLISMRKSPDVAVITNIEPNHLDVHASMEEYVDAKKNIFLHQGAFSRTVLNFDNKITKGFGDITRGETFFFSRREKCENGFYLEGGTIVKDGGEKILDISDIKIPGWHNVENYMAAIAAVYGDVSTDCIQEVARNFGGVEHRNELVRIIDGVAYYNDSIGSSPSRTINGALSLYDKKMILIAGGYDKNIPYDPLGPVIVKKVKTLILMGATADKIEAAVKNSEDYKEGCPEIIRAFDMQDAVTKARAASKPGDIVTLSPASASFDKYKNFEERGNHFKKIVCSL